MALSIEASFQVIFYSVQLQSTISLTVYSVQSKLSFVTVYPYCSSPCTIFFTVYSVQLFLQCTLYSTVVVHDILNSVQCGQLFYSVIIIIIIIIIMFIQTIQCSLTNIVSYTKKKKVLVHYNDEEMSNGGRIFTASQWSRAAGQHWAVFHLGPLVAQCHSVNERQQGYEFGSGGITGSGTLL